jgi:condensin complex subunit 2
MKRIQTLNISDTLASFKFSSDPNAMPDFTTLLGLKDTFDDSATPAPEGLSIIQEDEEDFFGGEDYDTGAPMPGGFDDMSNPADDQDGAFAGPSSAAYGCVGAAGPGEHMPFDGRRQGGELVMALMGDGDGDGMFDYFDKGFAQNWAGAEHWKLRKVTRKGRLACGSIADDQIQQHRLLPKYRKPPKHHSRSISQHLPHLPRHYSPHRQRHQ